MGSFRRGLRCEQMHKKQWREFRLRNLISLTGIAASTPTFPCPNSPRHTHTHTMERITTTTLRGSRRALRHLHSTAAGGLRAEASATSTAPDAAGEDTNSEASSSTSVSQLKSYNSSRPGRTDFNADYDIFKTTSDYQFDDATSLGWLRMEKIREAQELYRKVAVDRDVLKGWFRQLVPAVSK